jgi:putative heme transporter
VSVSDTTVAATASAAPGGGSANGAPDEHPGFWKRHRRAALTALGAVVLAGVFYFVVPEIAGLGPTLERLRAGDKWWLALGVLFEATSIGSEIALFRGVFSRPGNRVGWRTSYQIEMAGAAATKVLATAGAGGVALTVWALSAAGLPSPDVATGMVCFELLEYGLYAAALAVGGFGLWSGLFAGPAPIGLTLIPALLATAAIVIVLLLAFVGRPLERLLQGHAERSQGRPGRWWSRAAALPRSLQGGMRDALSMVRRRDPSLLGDLGSWGFDIGVLWVSFHAFGHPPAPAVLVMGYFVGTLGNTLPLPGGVGGVEGGMIGSFLAFGVNGGLAVLAVLAYRTISYWLPTIPGAIAYFRLRDEVRHWRDAGHGDAAGPVAT